MLGEELLERRTVEGEELRIVERGHVRRPRLPRQQRHLAEEVAGAERDVPSADRNLDLAAGDEEGCIAVVAHADDPFARQRRTRSEGADEFLALLARQVDRKSTRLNSSH